MGDAIAGEAGEDRAGSSIILSESGATVAVAFAVETAAVALSTAFVEFALDVFVVVPASVFLWWMLESVSE